MDEFVLFVIGCWGLIVGLLLGGWCWVVYLVE